MKWLTSYRLNSIRTTVFSLLHPADCTRPILIFGCQRSGTTMLSNVLSLSPQMKAYGEGDAKYFSCSASPRLLTLQECTQLLKSERSPFTLLKPLCESQRAPEIIEAFHNSKAIWMFRHHRNCVKSHVDYYRAFHDGTLYIKDLLQTIVPCWKNENLSEDIIDTLKWHAETPPNLATGYALFWLARNSLFFRLQVPSRVRLVNYEQVISRPIDEMAALFDFLEVPFKEKYAQIIISRPQANGCELGIDIEVARLCEQLYQQMLDISQTQNDRPSITTTSHRHNIA